MLLPRVFSTLISIVGPSRLLGVGSLHQEKEIPFIFLLVRTFSWM